MSESGVVGDTFTIRVYLYDGVAAVTGLTPDLTIERVSDGQYWNGAAFQAGFVQVTMTELSGNEHYAGLYEYDFAPPAADGEESYDYSQVETIGGRLFVHRDRLRTFGP